MRLPMTLERLTTESITATALKSASTTIRAPPAPTNATVTIVARTSEVPAASVVTAATTANHKRSTTGAGGSALAGGYSDDELGEDFELEGEDDDYEFPDDTLSTTAVGQPAGLPATALPSFSTPSAATTDAVLSAFTPEVAHSAEEAVPPSRTAWVSAPSSTNKLFEAMTASLGGH
ncbi:hypothetical protein DFJ73DRAFT_850035 [Zopfochytrium polystomum]|nr:hypothetical protein DFJ73DRAFT_850035 [Zopfochytrium polystomum]